MAKGGKCNFCGKTQKEVGPFVEGTGLGQSHSTYICGECVERAEGILQAEKRKHLLKKGRRQIPTPREVYDHLNRSIVGQTAAKRQLAVTVVNHYKRLVALDEAAMGVNDPEFPGVSLDKSNVLLLGPTGTGKTLLARALADFLHVPFAIGDATTLTEAGYVGEDVENLLLKLIRAADFDIEAAQRGIIYIDEVDKLHKTGANVSITRDVSGEGVQQSLLKMIEGTVSNVPPQGGRKHPEQQYVQIDTTNILFICGGAFVGLEDIISHRLGRGGMGFLATGKSNPKDDKTFLLSKVEQDDLEQFGLIPELVGRLPVVTALEELTEAQLEQILTGANGQPENALLKQYRKIARFDNVDLQFTDDAVREIALRAKKKGTGARALRSVVELVMADIMFDLPDHKGTTVRIDGDVVRGEKAVFPAQKEAA